MNKSYVFVVCLLMASCGGGGSDSGVDGGNNGADARTTGPNDVQPMLIAGGGVGSGAVNGEINVHVIDGDSGSPISGANVRVGDAAATTPLVNASDASGLAVFIDTALVGEQMVTVAAPGYAAATWIGVNGANVTIPLAKSQTAAVPMASVSGTISLPAPDALALDHYTLAVVLYSWSPNYGAPENTIPQPMNGDTPANICIRTALDGATCNWRMNTRVGKQIHYAVIVDGDSKGTTSDPSDDTYTILGYAVQSGLNLSAGQSVTNETLTMTSLAQTNVAVQFSPAPAGAGQRLAFPFIDAGEQGQLVFPLPTLTANSPSTVVPALAGPFSGMSYLLVGLAVVNSDTARPFSATFDRGLTFSGSESMNSFLPLPSAVSNSGDTYQFTGAPGASTHFVNLVDATDNPVWTVMILNGATSFTLPALSPDPRAGRNLQIRVVATEVAGFNANNFTVQSIGTQMLRVSEATN